MSGKIHAGALVRVDPDGAYGGDNMDEVRSIAEANGYIYEVVEPHEKWADKWYCRSIATGVDYDISAPENSPWRIWFYENELVLLEEEENE